MKKSIPSARTRPLMLIAFLVVLDQACKLLVAASISPTPVAALPALTDYRSVLGDGIRLVFIRNPDYAFGIAKGLPPVTQAVLFGVLPCLLLIGLAALYLLMRREIRTFYAWSVGALVAGALSNTIDRMVHGGAVTDYVLPNVLHRLGVPRVPIFNLGDLYVVVAVFMILVGAAGSVFRPAPPK